MPIFTDVNSQFPLNTLRTIADIAEILVPDINVDGISEENLTSLKQKLSQWETYIDDLPFDSLIEKGYSLESIVAFLKLVNASGSSGSSSTSLIEVMLQDTSELGESVKLPIVSLHKQVPVPAGTLVINSAFKVDAAAIVKYLDDLPVSTQGAPQTSCLVYCVEGNAYAGVDGAFSSEKGMSLSLQAGMSGSAEAQVKFYFAASADTPLFISLYRHVSSLSFTEPFKTLTSGTLRAIRVDLSAGLKAYAKVSAGYAWTLNNSQISSGADNVGVKVGVSGGVDYALNGDFELLAFTRGEYVYVEALRKSNFSRQISLSLEAKLITPGVKRTVSDYLKAASDLDDKLLNFLETVNDPKSQLIDFIQDQIKDEDTWKQDIVMLALGQDDEARLIKSLSERVAQFLDQPLARYDEWMSGTQETRILAESFCRLLGLNLAAQRINALEALFTQTAMHWHGQVKEAVLELVKDSSIELLAPLKAFGYDVDKVLTNVNELTDEVLAPVHRFRKHVVSRLALLEEFVNTSMIEEVGAAYSRTDTSVNSDSRLLKVKFPLSALASDTDTAKYFSACMSGDFSLVLKDDANPDISTSDKFTLLEASISAVSSKTKSVTFTLNLFGLESVSALLFDQDVEIRRDGRGQLTAFNGKGTFTQLDKFKKESNLITLSSAFNYLAQAQSKSTLNMLYSDATLTDAELAGFSRLYERTGAVTMQTVQAMAAAAKNAASKGATVTLQYSMSLEKDAFASAISRANEDIFDSTLKAYCLAYEKFAELEGTTLADGVKDVLRAASAVSLYDAVDTLNGMSGASMRRALDKVTDIYRGTKKSQQYRRATGLYNELNRAADCMVAYLRQIEVQLGNPVSNTLTEEETERLRRRKIAELNSLNELLDELIHSPFSILGAELERMHPSVIGFVLALQNLTGQVELLGAVYSESEPGAVVPVIVV